MTFYPHTKLPIANSQFSINEQFSIAKQTMLKVCKLLNEKLMKIYNCKLKIASPEGAA